MRANKGGGRELGWLESQYARLALDYRSSGMIVCGVTLVNSGSGAEFDDLVQRRLPHAMRTLQQLHPVLRCRLTQPHLSSSSSASASPNTTKPFAFKLIEDDNDSPPPPVEVYSRSGEYSWKSVWEDRFEASETRLGDALWRVCVVVGGGGEADSHRMEVLLGMNQFCCDGDSIGMLLRELLLHATSSSSDQPVVLQPPSSWRAMDEDAECRKRLPSAPYFHAHNLKSLVSFVKPLILSGGANNRLVRQPQQQQQQDVFARAKHVVHASTTHLRMHHLTADKLATLKQQCAVHGGCSLTSAVAAAFMCSGSQELHGSSIVLSVTFSTRGGVFSTAETASSSSSSFNLSPHTGCLIKTFAPRSKNTSASSFAKYATSEVWELAGQIEAWTAAARRDDTELAFAAKHTTDLLSFVPVGSTLARYPGLVVSRVGGGGGPVIPRQLGQQFEVERAVWAQNHRHMQSPLLCVHDGVEGQLTLSMMAPKPRVDARLMDAAFDRGVWRLEQEMTSSAASKM